MKITLLLLAAFPFLAFSQSEKGVKPTPNSTSSTNSTRAVVIGISDYQDTRIPDLRFADRDAEAFANYLRSPAGGSLTTDQLTILTNDQATAGRIAEALDALVEHTKEGEQVIIYFSGHGDVERNIFSQPGFLLCWDAPSRVYMGGGTFGLAYLEAVVTTLSVQNKAKVTVITDACHAGKLAGSQIGGAQLTAANLARQFANEVKILSCQPGELSLEGEQWGGGRGVFSYHLVDGLFGLADRNADGSVSLNELDRYLDDHVTTEAAPQSQTPMLLGNKAERLATVNAQILDDLKKSKAHGMPIFLATEQRGLEDEILEKTDSSTRAQYFAFKKAVREKRFFSEKINVGGAQNPADLATAAADELYTQLAENEALAPLRGAMRRNYAAALQDDAQQAINSLLTNDPKEYNLSADRAFKKYERYPEQLEKAAQLLGPSHYMYRNLKAKKAYFESYNFSLYHQKIDSSDGHFALSKLDEALHYQPGFPLAFNQKSWVYWANFGQIDSSEHYARLSVEAAPSYYIPYISLVVFFSQNLKQFDKAKYYLDLITQVAPSDPIVENNWALYYASIGQVDSALICYQKAIALDSSIYFFHANIASLFLETNQYEEAIKSYKKVIELDSTIFFAYFNLGMAYLFAGHVDEAEQTFQRIITKRPDSVRSFIGLALVHALKNNHDAAFQNLEIGIKNGWNNPEELMTNEFLAPLRADTLRWQAFMKKHFPDASKD